MFKSLALLASALFSSSIVAAPAMAAGPAKVVGDLPSSSAENIADFRRQADALYRLKEEAFIKEDFDAIVDRFYASNAIAVGPEGKAVIGRDAFRKEYQAIVKVGTVKVEPVTTHVGTDAAWEWVNFRVTPKDKTQKPFTFIMVFLFAKKDGHWFSGGDFYTIGEFSKGS